MNPRSLSIFLACLSYALRSSTPLPTQVTLSVPTPTQRPATRPTQRPSSVAARLPLQQQQQQDFEEGVDRKAEAGVEGASSHLRHRKWRLHSRWRKMARRGAAAGAEAAGEGGSEANAGSAGGGRVPHRTVASEPHASLRWTVAPPSAAATAASPIPPRENGGPGSTEPPTPRPGEAVGDGWEATEVVGADVAAMMVEEYSTGAAGEEGAEGTVEGEEVGAKRPAHGLSHTVGSGEAEEREEEEVVVVEEEESKEVREVAGGRKDDIVSRFLRIVESQQQHALGGNCTAGTELSLGDGVVDRYAQERFRVEAEVAVNRANMLTRLWKYAPASLLASEYLLHASLFSMVEFDEDIFAAGNCYDAHQYGNNHLYCPYAYRLPEGPILVKDLAVEYKYLTNSSEWFFLARQNANRVIRNFKQFRRGYNTYTYNETAHTEREPDEILSVIYEDGKWSRPYYDCGGGNIWMLTYTVPFFGYVNGTYFFKGTSGIDIDLRRVDIDQCPLPPSSTQLNIFAASDKCKKITTECVAIPGLGFRRGSYKCICREGFYFPDTDSDARYYNGSHIEMEYERLIMGEESIYSEQGAFECVPCAEGCERCLDGSPCIAALNWVLRSAVLCLSLATVLLLLPPLLLFTWKYAHVKVVRAASPVLLRVITLGAFFVYCTMVVMYPPPSVATCTARIWLREIGFSLTYGALMLKTWRISVIFRVRSAKAVKITDGDLLKRLGGAVAVVGVFLGIRTLVAPPEVIVGKTADDLKAYLCSTDWWDHSFTSLEVCFLIWGIRLCIVVRKAPSEFNESRFISMAIYNEFLLSLFLNISMLFLQSPANPDLLYMIFFCHTQLTITLLLCLIFGSKAYMVFKGRGKWCSSSSSEEGATGVGGVSGLGASRAHAAKFLSKPSSSSYTRSEQSLAVPSHPPLHVPSSASPSAPPQLAPAAKSLPPQKDQTPTPTLITDPQEEWERIVKQIHSLGSRLSEKDEAASLASKLALVLEVAAGGGSGAGYGAAAEEGEGAGKKGQEEEEGGGEEEEEGRGKKRMRWRRRKKEAEEAGGAYPPHRSPWSGGGEEWSGGAVRKRRRRGGRPEGGVGGGGGGEGAGEGEGRSREGEGGARRQGNDLRSGHARTHAIVIDLDDKNRFTEEVTV